MAKIIRRTVSLTSFGLVIEKDINFHFTGNAPTQNGILVLKSATHILTEQEIIRQCMADNAYCQRLLFDEHAGRMMTICLRYAKDQMEAEDLLLESFVKIFRFIPQYKFEGSFEGWMRRVVVNTALKHVQKKRIKFEELPTDKEYEFVDPEAFMHLGEKEILEVIKQLPDGYRIVFNLYAIEGYNHDEIAELLNIQPGTSRSQLVKARKMLQQQIIKRYKTLAA